MTDEELIARYVEPNPHKPSKAEAWLKNYGISVWALIAFWRGVGHDLDRVADAYEIPREAVEAAMAYYRRYQPLIDARLEANAA